MDKHAVLDYQLGFLGGFGLDVIQNADILVFLILAVPQKLILMDTQGMKYYKIIMKHISSYIIAPGREMSGCSPSKSTEKDSFIILTTNLTEQELTGRDTPFIVVRYGSDQPNFQGYLPIVWGMIDSIRMQLLE
ncbi:MAG: hypothetical protein WA941_01300 [Nitrososphaeraceae archaeon]